MSPYRTSSPNHEPQPKTPRRPISGLARAILWVCAGFSLSCWPIYGWVVGWFSVEQAFWCCLPAMVFVVFISCTLGAYGFFEDRS